MAGDRESWYPDPGILTSSLIGQKLNTVRSKWRRPEATTVSSIPSSGPEIFLPGVERVYKNREF